MAYDDVRAGKAPAHGSFRRTGDANPPIVSSGGSHGCESGLGLRAGPAHSLGLLPRGCEVPCKTVFCSRYLRRLGSAPFGEQNCTRYSLAYALCQEQSENKLGAADPFLLVMAGLVPAIHVFTPPRKGVDPRDKPGDDGGVSWVTAYP